MQRVARLSLFGFVVVVVLLGSVWIFREPLLSAVGISFDSGPAGETAVVTPDGFDTKVFASGLDRPRFMAVSREGVLFVAEAGADRVVALPDRDGDGRADETIVVGEDYESAHSLAFVTAK